MTMIFCGKCHLMCLDVAKNSKVGNKTALFRPHIRLPSTRIWYQIVDQNKTNRSTCPLFPFSTFMLEVVSRLVRHFHLRQLWGRVRRPSNSDRIRRNGKQLTPADYFFGLITQVWGDYFFRLWAIGCWEIKFWNTPSREGVTRRIYRCDKRLDIDITNVFLIDFSVVVLCVNKENICTLRSWLVYFWLFHCQFLKL